MNNISNHLHISPCAFYLCTLSRRFVISSSSVNFLNTSIEHLLASVSGASLPLQPPLIDNIPSHVGARAKLTKILCVNSSSTVPAANTRSYTTMLRRIMKHFITIFIVSAISNCDGIMMMCRMHRNILNARSVSFRAASSSVANSLSLFVDDFRMVSIKIDHLG